MGGVCRLAWFKIWLISASLNGGTSVLIFWIAEIGAGLLAIVYEEAGAWTWVVVVVIVVVTGEIGFAWISIGGVNWLIVGWGKTGV